MHESVPEEKWFNLDFGVRNQQTMHAKKCDRSSHLLKQGDITEQNPKSQQETLAYWRLQDKESTSTD